VFIYLIGRRAFVALYEAALLVVTSWLLATTLVSYHERDVIDSCASCWVAGGALFLSYSDESWLQELYYGAWKSVANNLSFSLLPALLIVLLMVCILLLLYSCNL
jgi:hypothetical protein